MLYLFNNKTNVTSIQKFCDHDRAVYSYNCNFGVNNLLSTIFLRTVTFVLLLIKYNMDAEQGQVSPSLTSFIMYFTS